MSSVSLAVRRVRRLWWRLVGRAAGASGDHPLVADSERARIAASDVGRLVVEHQGRVVHKWTHYPAAYSEVFSAYRDGFVHPDGARRPLRLIEIGVSHGGSLEIWRRYFGPDAVLVGIDVDERCAAFDGESAIVRIGSQADADFLRSVVAEMGGVDIVIDDGSHIASHQRRSFEVLFPLLSTGGLYLVEDLHTAYWGNFEGGWRRRGSFVEVVKSLIDDLHSPYHRRGKHAFPPGCHADRITVYDSIAVIRKASEHTPERIITGSPSF